MKRYISSHKVRVTNPRRNVIVALMVTAGAIAFGCSRPSTPAAPVETAPTVYSMPACTDQGDGEVWLDWNGILDCDLQPGQVFSYTGMPETREAQDECAFYGGTVVPGGVCYAVDF
jgi:hypothetical protein